MSPETLVLIQNQYGGLPLAAMGGGGILLYVDYSFKK